MPADAKPENTIDPRLRSSSDEPSADGAASSVAGAGAGAETGDGPKDCVHPAKRTATANKN